MIMSLCFVLKREWSGHSEQRRGRSGSSSTDWTCRATYLRNQALNGCHIPSATCPQWSWPQTFQSFQWRSWGQKKNITCKRRLGGTAKIELLCWKTKEVERFSEGVHAYNETNNEKFQLYINQWGRFKLIRNKCFYFGLTYSMIIYDIWYL